MIRSVRFLAFALVMTAGSAGAGDDAAVTGNLRTFCSGDYLRLCTGMDPKRQEVIACFRRRMAEVSPGCRTAIAEYQARSSPNR